MEPHPRILTRFRKSGASLTLLTGTKKIYSSKAPALTALIGICRREKRPRRVLILDKVVGRAAAVLMTLLKPAAVYAPLGSRDAIPVLQRRRIPFHFCRTVPTILNNDRTGPCKHDQLAKGRSPSALLKILHH